MKIYPLYTFCLLVLLQACSSATTALVSSWSDPNRDGAPVDRILVIGASDREQVRRTFERDLRDRIKASSRSEANASLEEMGVDEELSSEALKRHFAGRDIDAVLVTRVVEEQATASFDEGDKYQMVSPYANDFFAYYRRHIVKVPEPGTYETGRRVQVETIVFDAATGEPRWQCVTQSFDQGNTLKVIEDLVKTVVKQLKQDGILL